MSVQIINNNTLSTIYSGLKNFNHIPVVKSFINEFTIIDFDELHIATHLINLNINIYNLKYKDLLTKPVQNVISASVVFSNVDIFQFYNACADLDYQIEGVYAKLPISKAFSNMVQSLKNDLNINSDM